MTDARTFAIEAHGDQVDKAGRPYIEHLDRVNRILDKLVVSGVTFRNIVYLHDVIEDTDVTCEQLVEHFGSAVAAGVVGLTRAPDETYDEFIRRVARSPHSVIKLADVLEHLAARDDGYELPPSLLRRYRRALSVLLFPDPPRT